jgi:hypothetical protein
VSDDFQIKHHQVHLRGGPLDGQQLGFSPAEFGHELRIAAIVRVDDRLILRELFYDVAGYGGSIDNQWDRWLYADYAATQDTELPRIE